MKKYLFLLLTLPFTTIEKKLYGMEQQNFPSIPSLPSFAVLLNSLPKNQQAETIQEETTVAPFQESCFTFTPDQQQNNVPQRTNPSTKRPHQDNQKPKSNKKREVNNTTSSSSSQINVLTNNQNQNTITTNTFQQGTSSNQQLSASEQKFEQDLAKLSKPFHRPKIINNYVTILEESPRLLQQINIFFTKLRYPQHVINHFSNKNNALLRKMITNRSANFVKEIFKLILNKINKYYQTEFPLSNLEELAKQGKQIAETAGKNETVKILELTLEELKKKNSLSEN